VADLSTAVAKAAVELVARAPSGQIDRFKKELADRTAALKTFLEQNPVKDFHLVPGGPEFRPSGSQAGLAGNPQAATPSGGGAPGGL
jgi:hypothetical protein